MCLNCGCGNPTRRQRPTDITLADLRRAADGSYTTVDSVIQNLRTALERLEATQSGLVDPGVTGVAARKAGTKEGATPGRS